MARPKSEFYSTIEYIGPRPQKPKRRNFFGGWVIIVIALCIACWFGKPMIPFLRATSVTGSTEQADVIISRLKATKSFGDGLAAAALEHSRSSVSFDPSYYKIPYPNGDIPANKGVAADVVIRSLRAVGIDLQALVHEDMTSNFPESFRLYPQLWGALSPDTNIDHRRVANLQRFFERKSEIIPVSRNHADYLPGDIVIWELGSADKHIGIIVPGPTGQPSDMWVVHNMGAGIKWEDTLSDYPIQQHFRLPLHSGR